MSVSRRYAQQGVIGLSQKTGKRYRLPSEPEREYTASGWHIDST
jgi:hypothetical protein